MGGILVLVLSLSMATPQDKPVAPVEQYRAILKEFGEAAQANWKGVISVVRLNSQLYEAERNQGPWTPGLEKGKRPLLSSIAKRILKERTLL